MLIKKSRTNYKESIYECDRCHKHFRNAFRKKLIVQDGKQCHIRKWDFCSKCYKALERGIEKGNRNDK